MKTVRKKRMTEQLSFRVAPEDMALLEAVFRDLDETGSVPIPKMMVARLAFRLGLEMASKDCKKLLPKLR
jgi:hypothetical protein